MADEYLESILERLNGLKSWKVLPLSLQSPTGEEQGYVISDSNYVYLLANSHTQGGSVFPELSKKSREYVPEEILCNIRQSKETKMSIEEYEKHRRNSTYLFFFWEEDCRLVIPGKGHVPELSTETALEIITKMELLC